MHSTRRSPNHLRRTSTGPFDSVGASSIELWWFCCTSCLWFGTPVLLSAARSINLAKLYHRSIQMPAARAL